MRKQTLNSWVTCPRSQHFAELPQDKYHLEYLLKAPIPRAPSVPIDSEPQQGAQKVDFSCLPRFVCHRGKLGAWGPLGGRPSSLNTEPLLQPWGRLPHWGCVFKAPYALREVNEHLWQIPNLCICCVAKQLLSVWRLPPLFMSQYLILNLEFPRSTRFLSLLSFEKEKLGCQAWVGHTSDISDSKVQSHGSLGTSLLSFRGLSPGPVQRLSESTQITRLIEAHGHSLSGYPRERNRFDPLHLTGEGHASSSESRLDLSVLRARTLVFT